jgi:hypothetical protein
MTEEPLPEHIESQCTAAAQSEEPVLLVGTDSSLLERVARRIHTLTPTERKWPPKTYAPCSCRANPERLKRSLTDSDTVHLADVERVTGVVAKLLLSREPDDRCRRVFSSTVSPAHWPQEGPMAQGFPGRLWRQLQTMPQIDVVEVHPERETVKSESVAGNATVVASGSECPQIADPANVFRRTTGGWEIRYADGPLIQVANTAGARAAAYLLDAWANPAYTDARRPMGGAGEVYEFMNPGRGVQGLTHGLDESADALHSMGKDRARLAEIEGLRIEIEEKSKSLIDEGALADLAKEDDRLGLEAEEIEADLNSRTNRQGRPRKPRAVGVDALDSALWRFRRSIESRCPKLHAHLKDALKGGADPSYTPDADVHWEIHLVAG